MSATTDRILDISEDGVRLSSHLEQLVIEPKDKPVRTFPFEELAVLIVSNPWVSYTHGVLQKLAEHRGVLVVCDARHLPVSMCLAVSGHSIPAERLRQQMDSTKPTQKRIWRALIHAKISAQAAILQKHRGSDFGLRPLLVRLKTEDPEIVESHAARVYWDHLFPMESFRRDPDAETGPNVLLNYGYAIVRAAVARAACGSGLNLALGVFHHNRYNAYCLADDLMEPFRPLVDSEVFQIVAEQGEAPLLDKNSKARLIGILFGRMELNGEGRTLFEIFSRLSASLARVYAGEATDIVLPEHTAILSEP